MVMILLGINHLISADSSVEEQEIAKLRNAVDEKEEVMTPQNLFRRFLGR